MNKVISSTMHEPVFDEHGHVRIETEVHLSDGRIIRAPVVITAAVAKGRSVDDLKEQARATVTKQENVDLWLECENFVGDEHGQNGS